jgi:hypothetical protein
MLWKISVTRMAQDVKHEMLIVKREMEACENCMTAESVNVERFTALFPWFTVTRDWITLLAHLAFGIALAGTCRLFSTRV